MVTLAIATGFTLTPAPVAADASTLDWTQVATTGPTAREGADMAFDSGRGRTVLFGGAEPGTITYRYDSDTWEFDGSTWSLVASAGPPAGAFGTMAYDSARGVTVLFGGNNATGRVAPTTWEWNGTSWSSRATAHQPPARLWAGMVYDSSRHVTVLFGGSGVDGAGSSIDLNDTWEYDGTDWRQVATPHSPPARMGLGLAFDPVRGKTVLFGGHTSTGTSPRLQDTWEYDGADWTQVPIANPPYARFWHSMAFDAALGQVVMFGGDYFVPFVTLGPNSETWGYDGVTWHELTPTDHPSARVMAPMAYDTARSDLVLFGGSNETNPDTVVGDTWTFGATGNAPGAFLSAPFINFAPVPVLGSIRQEVTLSDTGTAPLAISSIGTGGDFSASDDCPRAPNTLAAGGFCHIDVTFRPSTGDPTTGTLTIGDNAGTGTQSVALSGQGVWGFIAAAPASLDLGTGTINAAGPTLTAVETITVPVQPSIVTGFATTGPFSAQNVDCSLNTVLPSGATCHVQVNFAPSEPGTYSGQLVIQDDEPAFQRLVPLSATAVLPPVSVSLRTSGQAVYAHAITATVTAGATSGTATFTFNGRQIGGPIDLNASGVGSIAVPLDDSTVPTGAGTYTLTVTVHPTDGVHSDASSSLAVVVAPEPSALTWTGTGTMIQAASSATLAVVVAQPASDTQVDYTRHAVWARFDVTDGAGNLTTYYAQVSAASGVATASVATVALAPGAYRIRSRLVAAQGSGQASPYLSGDDAMTVVAVLPAKGGYVAGQDLHAAQSEAFVFVPGSTPSGAFQGVVLTRVTGADGLPHDAWEVVSSTTVTSISSHSHTVTVTGSATIYVVDAVTGVRYSAFDRTVTFSLTQNPDGSAAFGTGDGTYAASLPAGTSVNHL